MIKLQYRKGKEVVREINQPRISLGRDETNDIVLKDERVSGFHANLFYENGILECIDLGSANGTYLNGKMIVGRTELKPWDVLIVGDSELEIIDTDARRPTQEQPAVSSKSDVPEDRSEPIAFFKLLSGGPYPHEIIVRGRTTVGRSPDNTCIIDLDTISSHHAEIAKSKNGIEITDLGSANGTYVNDEKVQFKILRHGDQVRFDEVAFRVEIPGQEVDKTTVRPAINKTTVRAVIQDNNISPPTSSVNLKHETIKSTSESSIKQTEMLYLSPHEHEVSTISTGAIDDDIAPKLVPSKDVLSERDQNSNNTVVVDHHAAFTPPNPPTKGHALEGGISAPNIASNRDIVSLLFSPNGRINRLTFILATLAIGFLVDIILYSIMKVAGIEITVASWSSYSIWGNLINLYPGVCLSIKRLHDADRRGYLVWLVFPNIIVSYLASVHMIKPSLVLLTALIGLYPVVIMLFFKGNKRRNDFGPPPGKGFNKCGGL